jgi:uncharacterized protein (DUF305 family)
MRGALLGLGLLLAAAACDGEDPVDAALRDAAAARHAAAVKETATAEPARVEAPAGSADQAWIETTIADHRKAIAGAESLLANSQDAGIRRTAEALIAARKREIAELEALRPASSTGE